MTTEEKIDAASERAVKHAKRVGGCQRLGFRAGYAEAIVDVVKELRSIRLEAPCLDGCALDEIADRLERGEWLAGKDGASD